MSKPKGKYAVKEAVREIVSKMSRFQKFSCERLQVEVARIIRRPKVHEGTCLRKMRELRSEGEFMVKCIDNNKSLYQKL